MNRAVLAIALPVLLGGCTTLYPPLYSSPTVAAKLPSGDALAVKCRDDSKPLAQTIACAEILQGAYSAGYQESAKWQDASQLPIIGAAAAAAWIVLKDEGNAARKAGKIGIGALTYSAVRNQMLPSGLPDVFIKGHGALGCVIADGVYFQGDAANESFQALNKSLANTADVAAIVSRLRYTEPSDPGASPDLLKAARTLADLAIAAANTQLRTSRQERAAYQFASSPFRDSVSGIAAWVASKGRVRPNKSYDDLLKSMSSSPSTAERAEFVKDASDEAIQALRERVDFAGSPTSSELIALIGHVSQLLADETTKLLGNTPPYAARIKKVSECATDLSTD